MNDSSTRQNPMRHLLFMRSKLRRPECGGNKRMHPAGLAVQSKPLVTVDTSANLVILADPAFVRRLQSPLLDQFTTKGEVVVNCSQEMI